MAAGIYDDIYSTGARRKENWKRIFSLGSTKSTSKVSSSNLLYPIFLSMKPHCPLKVPFVPDDRLIIIFGHQQKCVVYKKANSTIAVLENAVFKQSEPQMMFDGDKFGAIIHKIEPILMYAVARKDFRHLNTTLFCRNDVVLILAYCREVFLGMTEDHRVGFFPSETVNIITNPKHCFFEGMTLTVTGVVNFEGKDRNHVSISRDQNYEITKGRDGLFDWFASNMRKVPLKAICEVGSRLLDEVKGGHVYQHTISNVAQMEGNNLSKQSSPEYTEIPSIPEEKNYCMGSPSRYIEVQNVQKHDSKPFPVGKCVQNPWNTHSSETRDRPTKFKKKQQTTMPTPLPRPLGTDPPPLPPRTPLIPDEKDIYENLGDLSDGNDEHQNSSHLPQKSPSEEVLYGSSRSEQNTKVATATLGMGNEVDSDHQETEEDNYISAYEENVVVPSQDIYDRLENKEDDSHKTTEFNLNKTSIGSQDEESTSKLHRPVTDKRDSATSNLYQNQEQIDIKKEISELRYVLQQFVVSQRQENLKSVDEPHYNEIPDVVSQREENLKSLRVDEPHYNLITDDVNDSKRTIKIKERLEKLNRYRHVPINDNLRSIVAEYIEPGKWHPFGRNIGVPVNVRDKIDKDNPEIGEKTYELLGKWHSRYGSQATLGVLLDALVEVNPEDLPFILRDILKNTAEDEFTSDILPQ